MNEGLAVYAVYAAVWRVSRPVDMYVRVCVGGWALEMG